MRRWPGKLSRSGRPAPGRIRHPGHAARTGRVAGRQHVRLPHHPAEGDPEIGVRFRTRIADGHGQARLEARTLKDVRTGQREQVPPRPSSS
jgi:hypothetical protein